MAVSPEISRGIMREELALIKDLARTLKWGIVPNFDTLDVLVTMFSLKGDLFILTMHCDDYKEKPPMLEFIDPDTGEIGTTHSYPKTNDSFFHPSGPCICAPFSRKAYKTVVSTGPHQDWNLNDWVNSTASNVHWANHSRLGDMIGLVYSRISRPEYYQGRMS